MPDEGQAGPKPATADASATSPDTAEKPDDAPALSSIPRVARAQVQSGLYNDAVETLRKRSDITAKAIAGLGSSAVGGFSIAKLTDVWPPGEPTWAIILLPIGFFLMGLTLALLARRIWRVQEPVVMDSGQRIVGLSDAEKLLVKQCFDEIREYRDVESLRAYEARGERFERVSARLELDDKADEDSAKRLLEESQVILAEVTEARARGGHAVVRKRVSSAFYSKWSVVLVLLFGAGFFVFGLAADRLDSERSGQIAFAKDCATALGTTNIDKGDLPAACEQGAPSEPKPNPCDSDCAASGSTTGTTTTTTPTTPTTTTTGGK
jgi:hypothetical protein